MTQLTIFRYDVLASIRRLPDNPNGLDIKRDLEQHHDADVDTARLYQNLDSLHENGYINRKERMLDDRSNAYQITEDGKAALDHRIAILQPDPTEEAGA